MEAVFVLGVIFSFIVILVWQDTRKKERMFLLKLGKDPNIADSKDNTFTSTDYLKWGIIIISVGVGTLLGALSPNNTMFIAYLMICSGVGIVVSFLVSRKANRDYDKKNVSDIE
ncbi:MAG: hypothetical protein FWF09_04835 [Bacteroidales bacterium]|nr:hypothetical protein [Bacteroidales bacterium]